MAEAFSTILTGHDNQFVRHVTSYLSLNVNCKLMLGNVSRFESDYTEMKSVTKYIQ